MLTSSVEHRKRQEVFVVRVYQHMIANVSFATNVMNFCGCNFGTDLL